MTLHVIAYRSLELLFGTHTFHFNCFFEDFNCVFTQIRCLSRVLVRFDKTSYLFIKTRMTGKTAEIPERPMNNRETLIGALAKTFID